MSRLVYVERDETGAITGIYKNPQPGFAEEELRDDHPGLIGSGPAWAEFRTERNRRLAACDWTQLADAPLSEEKKALWVLYRRLLRALPLAGDDPAGITWPLTPDLREGDQ